MPTYRITRAYVVEASSKVEARNIFSRALANNKEDEFLENINIKEADHQVKNTGWASLAKKQLLGSSN